MDPATFADNPLDTGAVDRGALSPALQALWHERRGDWGKAHELVQDNSPEDCWVHAYLHRVEGDQANAAYWYRRADKPVATGALADEWLAITAALLG